ncbi:ABC transporter substrate-binding protein [Bacillus chungangensis]|uniref:Iron complex transport system substrate-binding protein n=1 Tax=Bacillus chungangensis TaxID=587633 RepID=A0ABT9WUS2_9BACI|nr:iron-siderophore ABC transporter substrate-binding protein [Bacillus chungangensis]MDQ0176642.1 iron complex transport system substrate-binding protein [Bacillus chungangensis]
MKKIVLLIVFAIFFVAACANKSEQKKEITEGSKKDAITIEHSLGKATFDEAPKRVVILEWNFAEDMLALDMQPVGLTDIEGFNKWVNINQKISDDVVDVGKRQEPNLEEIAKLNPDVIITFKQSHEKIQKDLEKIAPTIFYELYTEKAREDQYENMISNFKTTAKLLQKEAEADHVLKQLEEKYQEAKKEIDTLQLPTNQFVLTQAFSANQAPSFRLFTQNSTASKIFNKVGLENIITEEKTAEYGFIKANVEGLAPYQDALLIHSVQKDDPLFNNLKNNQVWQNYSFVKEDKMYDLGGDSWLFGGVLSVETIVDNLVSALKEG